MEYVDYNNSDITDYITQPNDNILDNADFRSGIINQKGQTTYIYSKPFLTIDRWISYGPNINVNSNSITMANRTSDPHTVQQPLYTQYKAGDKVTFYASVFNITGNVNVYLTGLDAQKKKLVNGNNIFTFTLTSELDRIYIHFDVGASASFNCLKLEAGDHFTGMPVWNEAEEMNKCKYYFERINVSSWGYFTFAYVITRTNTAEFPYKFSKKIKIPTITLAGQLKILFYEIWSDCTINDGPISITKDQFRYSFTYTSTADRANGTSCPIALVDTGNGTYIDIDAYDY